MEFDEYHSRKSGRGYVRIVRGKSMEIWVHPGYVGDRMEIGSGWKTFIDHYNIQEEHTLLLSYKGGNYFEVNVFEKDWKKIPYYSIALCHCYNPQQAGGVSLENPMEEKLEDESQTIEDVLEEINNFKGSSADREPPNYCGLFNVIVDKLPGCSKSQLTSLLVYPFLREFESKYYYIETTTRVWRVMLEFDDGFAWFSTGWDEFIAGKDLKLWSVLEFKVYDATKGYMMLNLVQFVPPPF